MRQLTQEGRRLLETIAVRHQVSAEAATTLLFAVLAGHGTQAQFNHPELGGMGQWSLGGMTMVSDMFNNALKARVDALCTELSALLDLTEAFAPEQTGSRHPASSTWWPADLGTPASVGAQNDLRYAYFPESRRLAIEKDGRIDVHETGEHRISGVSQQQGRGQSITFTSQLGPVRVADLPTVQPRPSAPAASPDRGPEGPAFTAAAEAPAVPGSADPAKDDIFGKIERLGELRRKELLTEEEYVAKKAELLSRI